MQDCLLLRRGFPGSSADKESACHVGFYSWVGKIRWRRDRLPTPIFLGFPGGSAGKESVCNVGDLGSVNPNAIPNSAKAVPAYQFLLPQITPIKSSQH